MHPCHVSCVDVNYSRVVAMWIHLHSVSRSHSMLHCGLSPVTSLMSFPFSLIWLLLVGLQRWSCFCRQKTSKV